MKFFRDLDPLILKEVNQIDRMLIVQGEKLDDIEKKLALLLAEKAYIVPNLKQQLDVYQCWRLALIGKFPIRDKQQQKKGEDSVMAGMSNEEAVALVNSTNETLVKVSSESDSLLREIERLEKELANAGGTGGTITAELEAAIKAVDTRAKSIDSLVADVAQPESQKVKLLAGLGVLAGLACASAQADPNGNAWGWHEKNDPVHNVPDAGSTAALLGMSLGVIELARRKMW